MALISERFCKNMVARFSPGCIAQSFAYQLSNLGEGRVSFNDTLCCIDFVFLVLNNLVIDCVSGYVSALLNLVGEFCIDMAPCWSGSCHVHERRANLLAGGTVRGPLAVGTVFEAVRPCFCEFGPIQEVRFGHSAINKTCQLRLVLCH